MPATPVRAAPAPEPLAALLAGLDAFERFANQLDSSSDAQPAISRLASLTSIIDTFEQSDRASETKSTKDTLDQHGSELWNRSTTLHHALKTTAPNEPWNRAFALLRQTGYQLILLGGIEPYTTDFHVKLLSLSTKVALAFLAHPRPSDVHTSSTMLSTAASHVALLSLLPPADRSSDVDKALLAFYTARIRVCVQEENWTVARWCMSKAKDLALEKSLSVYTLAALALKIGAALVDWVPSCEMQEEAGQKEKGTRLALAIQWLLEATELAEKHGGTEMDMMQTSTMEALAQAYLLASPPRSGWNKAEEVIVELLKLRPSSSPTLYRRLIKLMIARSGGDGEIAVAFASAAQHLPWSQTEGSRLLAEMHCLPSDRRLAKFAIIASLLDVACSRFAAEVDVEMQLEEDSLDVGVGPAGFVAQCLMAAVFTANDKDKQRVSDLFDRVVAAAPTLCITINPAFVCSTYLWRQGDKAHRLKTFEVAAAWYLLAAHPVLRSLEEKIWQKCFRKAALCYSEVAMYDEADAVISRCSGPDSAKNHFVRFYNATLKRDEVQAVNSLKALADATDLEVKMLLWAAKAAHESGLKPLLTVVLETLLEMGRRDSAIVGVDLVVLIRTLVRLVMVQLEVDASNDETINILLRHLETSLQLIKRIASSSSRSLLKDTTWLHKTAYNLCIRYATLWTTAQLIGFYSVAAHLAEFAAGSGSVEQETASIALHCRFASVSGRMQEARLLKDETSKMVAFNALVPQITTLQTQLKNAAFTHPQLDRLLELTNAVLALEVETFCAVKDWRKISQLFEELGKSGSSSAIDVQLLKIIAEKVLAAQDCPLEIVSSILQKTPAVLLARKDLKTESLAAWFRTIVTFALSKSMMEDAYTFMQSSVGLLQSQPSQFPSDELDWFIATAWDQGLDLFASSDIQRAQQWSSLALSAARFADSALESRLRTFFEGLCSRHLLNPAECQ